MEKQDSLRSIQENLEPVYPNVKEKSMKIKLLDDINCLKKSTEQLKKCSIEDSIRPVIISPRPEGDIKKLTEAENELNAIKNQVKNSKSVLKNIITKIQTTETEISSLHSKNNDLRASIEIHKTF